MCVIEAPLKIKFSFLKFLHKTRKMKALYNLVFKRTSTYAVGIIASAFFFERAFDLGAETLFYSVNKGVRKMIE